MSLLQKSKEAHEIAVEKNKLAREKEALINYQAGLIIAKQGDEKVIKAFKPLSENPTILRHSFNEHGKNCVIIVDDLVFEVNHILEQVPDYGNVNKFSVFLIGRDIDGSRAHSIFRTNGSENIIEPPSLTRIGAVITEFRNYRFDANYVKECFY